MLIEEIPLPFLEGNFQILHKREMLRKKKREKKPTNLVSHIEVLSMNCA